MDAESRLLSLVQGGLAANIFDWGARACVDLYHDGTILDIYQQARSDLSTRPWRVDHFDAFAELWHSRSEQARNAHGAPNPLAPRACLSRRHPGSASVVPQGVIVVTAVRAPVLPVVMQAPVTLSPSHAPCACVRHRSVCSCVLTGPQLALGCGQKLGCRASLDSLPPSPLPLSVRPATP